MNKLLDGINLRASICNGDTLDRIRTKTINKLISNSSFICQFCGNAAAYDKNYYTQHEQGVKATHSGTCECNYTCNFQCTCQVFSLCEKFLEKRKEKRQKKISIYYHKNEKFVLMHKNCISCKIILKKKYRSKRFYEMVGGNYFNCVLTKKYKREQYQHLIILLIKKKVINLNIGYCLIITIGDFLNIRQIKSYFDDNLYI